MRRLSSSLQLNSVHERHGDETEARQLGLRLATARPTAHDSRGIFVRVRCPCPAFPYTLFATCLRSREQLTHERREGFVSRDDLVLTITKRNFATFFANYRIYQARRKEVEMVCHNTIPHCIMHGYWLLQQGYFLIWMTIWCN